jgi:sialidase-1
MAGPAGENTNEWMLVQRRNGVLLANMRGNTGRKRRAISISADNGKTWSGFQFDEALVEPGCQASLIRYDDAQPLMLFSNPADTERRKLTVKVSRDEGQSWPIEKLLCGGPSAYSCLAVLPDGQIGILYECGVESPYETVTFAKFPREWLLN